MPVAFLRFDVDSLIMVLVINDYREDQALRVAGGEAGVAVTAPLHRRAHSVAVTQIDIIAHSNLVAVVEHRGSWQREQQSVD